MKTVVVYESSFGNTRTIAEAVARGIEIGGGDVELIASHNAPATLAPDVGLVVVGAPTHNLGMPTTASRAKAAQAGGAAGPLTGVREWIAAVQPRDDVAVATFDTAAGRPLSGSAAKQIAKTMRRRGFAKPASIKSFVVGGTSGPLQPGQVEAALTWGQDLIR